MDLIPLKPERRAQLEEFAQRRGQDPATALDDALAVYLESERNHRAAPSPESPEMAWLVSHAQELAQHKGEWLLIQGTQLLVHSRDFTAVRAAVQERQISSPFVYYVPTDEESNSVTI